MFIAWAANKGRSAARGDLEIARRYQVLAGFAGLGDVRALALAALALAVLRTAGRITAGPWAWPRLRAARHRA